MLSHIRFKVVEYPAFGAAQWLYAELVEVPLCLVLIVISLIACCLSEALTGTVSGVSWTHKDMSRSIYTVTKSLLFQKHLS